MARHPDLGFQVLDDTWFADALEADLPLFDDWAARLVMGETRCRPASSTPTASCSASTSSP